MRRLSYCSTWKILDWYLCFKNKSCRYCGDSFLGGKSTGQNGFFGLILSHFRHQNDETYPAVECCKSKKGMSIWHSFWFICFLGLSHSMKWADVLHCLACLRRLHVSWSRIEVGLLVLVVCWDLVWIFKAKVSREIAQFSPSRTRTYATGNSGSNGPVSKYPPA